MCKIIYLICVATNLAIVSGWDFAITTKTKVRFFNNDGTQTNSEDWHFSDLNAMSYDLVNNVLYFVDNEHENTSISSLQLPKKEYKQIIKRRPGESILGIAFDPLTEMLFWVNPTNKSILMASLSPGVDNGGNGQILLQMKNELPHAIAVDSCRRYIYWTNANITKPTIERSRFDGSQRQVVVHEDLTMPVSVVIDQESQRIYWADVQEGLHFSIASADLDGKNRKLIYSGINHQVNALAVKNNTLYWTDRHMFVWSYPITNEVNSTTPTEPVTVVSFTDEEPLGIVTNIDLQQHTREVSECKSFIKAYLDKHASINRENDKKVPSNQLDTNEYCLNKGRMNMNGGRICQCEQGFTGKRCEIPLCHNYCLEGTCVIGTEGGPRCICKPGYSGDKCENNDCQNHCINGGTCSISINVLKCVCPDGYIGTRCEISTTGEKKSNCNCSKSVEISAKKNLTSNGAFLSDSELSPPDYVGPNSCYDFEMRDPILLCLGTLCGLLCLLCAVLISRILNLKKRPRIKKRIIVNKNVTPLTCRPEPQCEITIENCCNMNICETPCFETQGLKPSQQDSTKAVKEEKRNLIMNMEHPDDLY